VLLNLYFNFRSFALVCFVTLCVAAFKIFNYRKLLSPRKVALMSLALGLGLVCFQQGYVFAVTRGWLGADALGKYENQAHGDLGMLLGGRSEAFSSVQAVRDSPIIGHGSYAKDQHYVDLMLEAIVAHGYTTGDVETEGIPTHSHLMGAWVEAGILGAIFWGWVFFLAAKGLLITIGKSRELLPLTVFSGTILLWDILFSPYADMRRFTTTFFVIAMMRAISVASAIQPEGRRVAGSGNGRLSGVRAADLAVTN
jgi:O-antigen ligase